MTDEARRHGFHISPDYEFLPTDHETDVTALADGYITVTPLVMNLTAVDELKRLTDGLWDNWPAEPRQG